MRVQARTVRLSALPCEFVFPLVAGRVFSHSYPSIKFAQLSGNGCSEELEKNYWHGPAFQAGINKLAGLGKEKNLSDSAHFHHESGVSAPPGFGIDEVSAPPGFEDTFSPEVSQIRKVKGTKRLNGQSTKRVTRGQVKQSKK